MQSNRDRMMGLGQKTVDQNNQLIGINRLMEEATDTQNNILRNLDDQRYKIDKNIQMNDEIRQNVALTNKKTNQMRRRNICIKVALYISILALFGLIVILIILKLGRK